MFQIECTFQNLDTKLEKEIGFIDNCFWIDSGKFSLSQGEYSYENIS